MFIVSGLSFVSKNIEIKAKNRLNFLIVNLDRLTFKNDTISTDGFRESLHLFFTSSLLEFDKIRGCSIFDCKQRYQKCQKTGQ